MRAQRSEWRALLLATAAAVCMTGVEAYAQDDDEEDEAEVITVTGSRLRRDEFTSPAPIQVITAEAASLEGLLTPADILQGSSVAAGSVQLNNRFGGFVIEGGTGVRPLSLRGLGGQRTLVLLNGRRPGPAGVRGQVAAFDLNVVPESIVQRYEILKDGASSVYGSDAVAGVANIITRTSVDQPELTVSINAPLEGQGDEYKINGAYGLNFDRGNIVLAGEYQYSQPIRLKDRDFLECQRDLIRDGEGNLLDREDRSITAGAPYSGCFNLYANTFIEALFTGARYIPSPDGVTIGPVDGYRPRTNAGYTATDNAYYEDVLFFPFVNNSFVQAENQRTSLYAASNFEVGPGINWQTEALYTQRETTSERWRQFFPLVSGATGCFIGEELLGAGRDFCYDGSPDYDNPLESLVQPIMPYPSNEKVTIDYWTLSTQLDGSFGGALSNWGWSLSGNYSYSDGERANNVIVASRSGDVRFDTNAPVIDYFSPTTLSGDNLAALMDAVGDVAVSQTIYEQYTVTGVVTGEVFTLPAGAVAVALGAEYRDFELEDTPHALEQDGDLWGQSSAGITAGSDNVAEIFGEIEVPILAGLPLFEELTFSGSARAFDYESYGSDSVWKAGLNWQINPLLRLRGTHGTSYRAPALYELFLANQTSFLDQNAIDPCIQWGNSSNENIRANCAADGVPADYAGGGSSATIVTGGGIGVLEAETSEATTIGVIVTPSFLNLSVAVDYFSIEVNDEVDRLGAANIVGACYALPVHPNAFCDLFDRSGTPGFPFAISQVNDSYLNLNNQLTEGFDITARYEHEFNFGTLLFEGQATRTTKDIINLFDVGQESGFETNDFNGTIGDPKWVSNTRVALQRGDWTFNWFMDYVDTQSNSVFVNDSFTYFNFPEAVRDVKVEEVTYHDFSARWERDNVVVIVGIENAFDERPPLVSDGTDNRLGNVPLSGTQYRLSGRSAFVTLTTKF